MPRDDITDDSYLLTGDVLPSALVDTAFQELQKELTWSTMYHKGGAVPRMVCIQGLTVDDGEGRRTEPIYRHPADEQPPLRPFTSTVDRMRRIVSERKSS